MRIRLKRDHFHNGTLKKARTIIDLVPEAARLLIAKGVAEESAPPVALNQRKK